MRNKSVLLLIFITSLLFQSCNLSDTTEMLGDGYFFRNEGNTIKDILCEVPGGGQVPATVIDYKYDKSFIIAKQKPKLPQDILYDKKYNYDNGDNDFYYWLIVKNEHTVLGPYNLLEFKNIKVKYNVPEGLILK